MKDKRPYSEVIVIAERIKDLLEPYSYRIQIAGSLRRKAEMIGDIELVIIPKPYEIGLFEDGLASVVNQWEKVKGELEYGKCKYTQRILPEGIKLDIFFATETSWGNTLAVRTGSADYAFKVLASGWKKAGYESRENYIYEIGTNFLIPMREEEDLFDLIGIPFVEPVERII